MRKQTEKNSAERRRKRKVLNKGGDFKLTFESPPLKQALYLWWGFEQNVTFFKLEYSFNRRIFIPALAFSSQPSQPLLGFIVPVLQSKYLQAPFSFPFCCHSTPVLPSSGFVSITNQKKISNSSSMIFTINIRWDCSLLTSRCLIYKGFFWYKNLPFLLSFNKKQRPK